MTACCLQAQGKQQPQPAWGWFGISNVIAVGAFLTSMSYLLSSWMATSQLRVHTPAYAFSQPAFILAVVAVTSSLLYFFAFFGIAFIYQDVASVEARTSEEQHAATTSGSVRSGEMQPKYDADVVIVGAGTAGAALATVLARDGKKVVLIER